MKKILNFKLKISYYKNIKRIKQSSELTKTVINKQIFVKKSKIVAEHNTHNNEAIFQQTPSRGSANEKFYWALKVHAQQQKEQQQQQQRRQP